VKRKGERKEGLLFSVCFVAFFVAKKINQKGEKTSTDEKKKNFKGKRKGGNDDT
jgi:hypothetical protein